MTAKTTKPETRKAATPQRVEVKDRRGNIARPYEKDIGAWLAKGWQRVNSVKVTD